MPFNFLEKIQEVAKKTIEENKIKLENTNISQEEIELAQKLEAIEEFSIDRFEGEIAVLENRKTGSITNIERNKLPENIKEGDILKKINGKYSLDAEKTVEESNRIKNKMKDLWNE